MKRTCFVVCPIGQEGSEIRNRADIIFNHIVEPACDKFSLTPLRSDKIAMTGVITHKIIKHLKDSDIVIADLTGHNPNVFYELGIRHALGRPVIIIKSNSDKRPFDIQSINILDYSSLDHVEMTRLKGLVVDHIDLVLNHRDEIDDPLAGSLMGNINEASELKSEVLDIKNDIRGLREDIINTFSQDSLDKTRINAQYLDGEDRAFQALTEATKRAKKEIRSSRFFPDSVLGQQTYVNAIESRVKGSDGMKPLNQYYRIVALNNPEKLSDIIHHITIFKGRPFQLHLAKIPNAFELVVIDDTDAFIHFYKERMVIASTLHIKERSIVWEFREIYDKMLQNTESNMVFTCSEITNVNLGQRINDVTEIFSEAFGESTMSEINQDQQSAAADADKPRR